MSLDRTYWRPAYEMYAAMGWLVVVASSVWIVNHESLPPGPFYYIIAIGIGIFLYRILKGAKVWRYRRSLFGKSVEVITPDIVQAKMEAKPGHLWIGKGFDWDRVHMQRLYDLEKLSKTEKQRLNPPWPFNAKAKPSKGSASLHGVEPKEEDIYVPLKDIEGHMFVPATTGAIKTRMLSIMVSQAIRRNPKESVIIIDPKFDESLAPLVKAECIAAGREDDFAFINPAMPEKSARLDPLRTWTRSTEVATRIQSITQGDSTFDPWSAFGWRASYYTAEGLIHGMREYPSIKSIKRYVEGGIDVLLHKTIANVLEDDGIDWKEAIKPFMKEVTRTKKPDPTTPDETVALALYYKVERFPYQPVSYIDGLLDMFYHDREHYQKMINNLLPSLTMMTAGELEDIFSPNRNDPNDHRPILDASKIIDGGMVLYLGLDANSDPIIASAIGSIVLADIAAVSGRRAKEKKTLPKVNVFVDEANSCANPPLIELMNKSRSSGFTLYLYSQLYADFIAKLGKEELARQILGNANSTIAGRSVDGQTVEYVTETFGRTILKTAMEQHSTSTSPNAIDVANFTGSYGVRTTETLSEIVPPEALTKLPDLEYFGSISGGRIVKGRIPVLALEEEIEI